MRGLIEYGGIVLLTAALFAVVGAVYVAASAYFGRVRMGRCSIRRSRAGESVIDTDLGQFTITGDGRLLVAPASGEPRSIPLAAVRAARFNYAAKPDVLAELAYGFAVWDLCEGWRDRTEWYEIALVTTVGEIPIFVAGQRERREPLLQWWFDLVNDSLSQ